MSSKLVVKCVGTSNLLPVGVRGIWRIKTDGHPEDGIRLGTHDGFVIEADTYEQVVRWLKRRIRGNPGHTDYKWVVNRIGIAYSDSKRVKVILESFNAD